jgi:hypothetical protein
MNQEEHLHGLEKFVRELRKGFLSDRFQEYFTEELTSRILHVLETEYVDLGNGRTFSEIASKEAKSLLVRERLSRSQGISLNVNIVNPANKSFMSSDTLRRWCTEIASEFSRNNPGTTFEEHERVFSISLPHKAAQSLQGKDLEIRLFLPEERGYLIASRTGIL